MAWRTPKTDWHGSTNSEGVYTGDRFNASDFNRIKNNLTFLRDMAIKLYKEFSLVSLGDDRVPGDYFYADEINQLEENLETLNANTLRMYYGSAPVYNDNGITMDFNELNRLEGATLDLYDRLTNESEGRRMFTWNFGMKGGKLLPVDYTDAVWAGLKRYNQINNEDGSVSFQDITAYTGKEKSFFGAKDANRMNEALNTIMSMVENGTDLYTAFQNYFAEQKTLFEQEADSKATEFDNYTDNLEQEYKASMAAFESQQQQIYNAWFQAMKDQLSKDAAGNLQNQCTELDERLTLLEQMTMQNDFSAPLATDDEAITLIVDDLDYAILADWKYKEE